MADDPSATERSKIESVDDDGSLFGTLPTTTTTTATTTSSNGNGNTDINNRILFLQTGGTIDKDYPRSSGGYAFEFGDEPATTRILDRLLPSPSFQYRIVTVFQKDSLDVTDEDRHKLVEHIMNASETKIIVTHGTDTMIETARFVETKLNSSSSIGNNNNNNNNKMEPQQQHFNHNKNKIKCIVFTGAMRPERFQNSDAPINIGCAISAVQMLGSGGDSTTTTSDRRSKVYVTMHGIFQPAAKISRNKETGQFIPSSSLSLSLSK